MATADNHSYDDSRDYDSHNDKGDHLIVRRDRSILQDLEKYSLSDEIKVQANIIYKKMSCGVNRGKKRFQLLFYCVYNAHCELEIPVEPIALGSMFGLESGQVQKAFSLFSELQTGYKPVTISSSALELLPLYGKKLRLTDTAIASLLNLAKRIKVKNQELFERTPQTIAAGILRYYLTVNGIILEDQELVTKITGRSDMTIGSICELVAIADNS